jgi:hypothetical protein
MRFPLLAALLLGALASSSRARDYVWIEGETPTKANVQFQSSGWGHPDYLSGGKWLFGSVEANDLEAKVPADGAVLTYDFATKTGGAYEAWARVGYEFARSPFSWRLDDGAWKEVGPGELTTDLMALAPWTEVAWLKLGNAKLTEGKHTFEVKFERKYRANNGKKEPERILFGLDCVCLVRGEFRPNGPHKPGSDWQNEDDRRAAGHVFEVKPGGEAGERVVTTLDGEWQIARWDEQELKDRAEPVKELPADLDAMFWKGIRVPGNRDANRPDLEYAHRYLYRTRVKVPADFKGRSFVLRFPSTALLASAFVNGKFCGGSKAPSTLWECDATAAVKPGEVNEIVVAVKDGYYALAQDGQGRSARFMFNVPHDMMFNSGGLSFMRYADFPIVLRVRHNGLIETPSLVVAGPAYAADVFVKPSVKKKQLGAELSFHNATDREINASLTLEVRPLGKDGRTPEGKSESFKTTEVSLAAGETKTVERTEDWIAPRLWWPDDPQQYELVTTLKSGGRVIDVRHTKFGFREWEWKGQHFTLNGVPWHLRADTDEPSKDPDEAVKVWKRRGQNMVRYWGDQPVFGRTQEESLDHFDRLGMPVRRSGIFDGEAASYLLLDDKGKPRRELFDNWVTQLKAWVRAERNHPSVFIWSVENEITYINARNLGWLPQVEPEIRRAVDTVLALDPTRPAMIDGGDALRDASLPVYGNHYNEAALREYPDEAYTMKIAFARHKAGSWTPWPIGDDRPLFLGESFFASGGTPSMYAQLQGEGAFLGWTAARPGVGLMAKMLAEGYRWHGVAAFHFWMGSERADLHYNSFQPVCVLCREWNWTFAGNEKVTRTLKVFNDTRFDDPIDVGWKLTVGGKLKSGGGAEMKLKPGETSAESPVNFTLPVVAERTAGEFVLTCSRGGKELFREVKPFWVIPAGGGAKPALTKEQLAVWDPKGVVKERLQSRDVPFTAVDKFEAIPATAKVVVVGPDALSPREATDPKWQALAAGGKRVLVLDQDNPLHYTAIPAELVPTDHAGRIAFSENLEHPAFAGLGQPDFSFWSGDHVVYRNVYRKSAKGARSLAQCDEELSQTALAECPVKDGLLVLCQLVVGSKLGSDPVAQRLFDNLLNHCAAYSPPAKVTAVVLPDGDVRLKLLAATGLKYRKTAALAEALADKANELVVADAGTANLKALAAAPDAVKAFTARGGWLILWGLTPDGLADFNKVVGQNHVIRPFRLERVTLPPVRDPLISGLTMRDVVLESNEKIYPWSGDRYPANDTLTYVVDLDDVAPFVRSQKYAHAWSQMTNGLTSADSWKFIFYHELAKGADPHPKWAADFPKEEEVTEFSIILNTHYNLITKMRLLFDGRAEDAMTLDLKPGAELRQDFAVNPPRKCKSIALEPLAWDKVGKGEVIGVDNVWIKVKRSDEYKKTVVPLLNIGGLVKYRMGPGGVLLNQVRVQEAEANPVNADKKQTVVATLLRNLGAVFAGERTLIPGANLAYGPVPLGVKCNQFLTGDKGWLTGQPDLAHFPVGENTLAGVLYDIRDFKTSPLPSCVMLAGHDAKGITAKSIDGIPVGRKADVLFFLHAFHQAEEWRPRNDEERARPPTVFEYVVHYADGKTAEVPVLFGRGVSHWITTKPQGLPGAAVAWAAPFPRDPQRQAVVYQMQWSNPRPGEKITGIDVRYDEKVGNRYGVPAVFGITAGTVRDSP